MKLEGIYKKYLLFYRLLRKPYTFPNHLRILSYLEEHGILISKRTLERDFAALRAEFGLSIVYSKSRKGYYMEEDSADRDDFFSLLELAENLSGIIHSYKDIHQNKKYIRFSMSGSFKGSELLPLLSEAIQSFRWVSFSYQSYGSNQKRRRKVIPLFLFEYKHRWYLLAQEKEKVKTFGLDRMTEAEWLPELFEPAAQAIDFTEYFRHTLGVSWYELPPEEIVLSFHPSQAPYLKALPLHHSQAILQDNSGAFVIRLRLIINFELKQEILSYGSKVKVLAPARLAEEIRKEYEEAIKNYEEY